MKNTDPYFKFQLNVEDPGNRKLLLLLRNGLRKSTWRQKLISAVGGIRTTTFDRQASILQWSYCCSIVKLWLYLDELLVKQIWCITSIIHTWQLVRIVLKPFTTPIINKIYQLYLYWWSNFEHVEHWLQNWCNISVRRLITDLILNICKSTDYRTDIAYL